MIRGQNDFVTGCWAILLKSFRNAINGPPSDSDKTRECRGIFRTVSAVLACWARPPSHLTRPVEALKTPPAGSHSGMVEMMEFLSLLQTVSTARAYRARLSLLRAHPCESNQS